jgi:hypothetical protein
MTTPSRNTVGVYDRPHPLRTRKVVVPVLVAVALAIAYATWWYVARS